MGNLFMKGERSSASGKVFARTGARRRLAFPLRVILSFAVMAQGNFEVVSLKGQGPRIKNVIVMIGDGMGIAHRTAARIMLTGVAQGKPNALLSMDTFPYTGLVSTHSLNSIVTDSSPGAACYANGNKANNNQHGFFPDCPPCTEFRLALQATVAQNKGVLVN